VLIKWTDVLHVSAYKLYTEHLLITVTRIRFCYGRPGSVLRYVSVGVGCLCGICAIAPVLSFRLYVFALLVARPHSNSSRTGTLSLSVIFSCLILAK
jgi:hypothetical protein